jgi:hypothetical protein
METPGQVCLMSGMKHPNVVDLKDVVKDYPPGSRPGGAAQQKKMLIMIIEKLTGGELFSEVLDNGAPTQPASQPASQPAGRTQSCRVVAVITSS